MGGIHTTIQVDGEPVERNSVRAYEIASQMLSEVEQLIQDISQLGLEDKELHRLRGRAARATSRVSGRAGKVADEARRLEKLGDNDPVAHVLADLSDH